MSETTGPVSSGTQSGRVSLADKISASLREDILTGAWKSGEPLRQAAIAKQFETSRVPVREALRQLEAEGLVTFHPHRGAIVSTIEPSDVLEMFDIRLALECYLLRLAVPNMVVQDFEDADLVLDLEVPESDSEEWDALNWRFHYTLYLPAHRPKMLALVESNYFNAARFLRVKIAEATGRAEPHKEHVGILAACREGDVDAAVALLEGHLQHTKKSLATKMQRLKMRF